jgi:hypothetical protein
VKHPVVGNMGREDEKDDVGSYCIILQKREYTGIWKRKH